MKEYIDAFSKYFEINGRASRRDYWMFILFNLIFFVSLIILSKIISLVYFGLGILILLIPWFIYCFIVFIPSFTVTIRRLHDINKSGLWYLINFIPFIGGIWFLILLIKKSDSGENKYGPVPQTSANSKEQTMKAIRIIIFSLIVVFLFIFVIHSFEKPEQAVVTHNESNTTFCRPNSMKEKMKCDAEEAARRDDYSLCALPPSSIDEPGPYCYMELAIIKKDKEICNLIIKLPNYSDKQYIVDQCIEMVNKGESGSFQFNNTQ